MRHLVLGGTGLVGSHVVEGLLKRGEDVRVMTRSPEKAAALPDGVVGVVGNLRNPETYGPVFRDFDNLFLLNLVTEAELQEGLAAFTEARRAGAKRIVYLSVQHADRGPHVPHFGAKWVIEEAIKASGIPYIILRPSNFYQNDFFFRQAILDYGVYPQPIGDKGLSRVDVRDIGVAAVRALTGEIPENRTYNLVGPDVLTGEDTARIYSEVLGREVRYGGDDLAAWYQQAKTMLPPTMAYDFRIMYELFQAEGLIASDTDLEETETAVGRPPIRFADFAREVGASWLTENEMPSA